MSVFPVFSSPSGKTLALSLTCLLVSHQTFNCLQDPVLLQLQKLHLESTTSMSTAALIKVPDNLQVLQGLLTGSSALSPALCSEANLTSVDSRE